MGLIEEFYDEGIKFPKGFTPEAFEQGLRERLVHEYHKVTVCSQIPRRLGADATREEMALDKKRARRVLHALATVIGLWGWNWREDVDDEVRAAGAQLKWDVWQDTHLEELETLMRKAATYASEADERQWGNIVLHRLRDEMERIEYALRD